MPITLSGSELVEKGLTFEIVSRPTRGTLAGTPPDLVYTPGPNQTGKDEFVYEMRSPVRKASRNPVSITIEPVNDPPIASPLSFELDEDTTVRVVLNATDVDGDKLNYQILAPGVSHGTLTGTAPELTYTPATNFFGIDQFKYVASDGVSTSAPAPVILTVRPVNDPPVPRPATVVTIQGRTVNIVLESDDPEGDPVTYEIATQPSHGRLEEKLGEKPPTVIYWPNPGFVGEDQFAFRARDQSKVSDPGIVQVLVSPPISAKTSLKIIARKQFAGPFHVELSVRNDGDEASSSATVVLVPPSSGIRFSSASGEGKWDHGQVTWALPAIPARKEIRLDTTFVGGIGEFPFEARLRSSSIVAFVHASNWFWWRPDR